MAKAEKLSDEDILAKVDAKSREAVGWYDSRLSKERQRVLDYYNGRLPRRQHQGRSSYISNDVYDSVEMSKTQLLEVFAGGDEIVQFDADQEMNEQACKAATAYARYVIFQQNDGYQVFNDVIHDSVTARVGVAKVWWDERHTFREQEFSHQPEHLVMQIAAHPDVDELDADQDETTGLYSGRFVVKIDKSQVCVEAVAPEEFLIQARAVSIKKATYVGHRSMKTKAELIEMGLDKDKVNEVNWDDSKGLELSPERLAREAPVETAQALDDPIQPELQQVMLYESYVRMRLDGRGVRLWCILHAGSVIFDKYEVDRSPFLAYVPLPVPHTFYGNNFAGRVMMTQNARTVLTRAVLDHASITNNPRYTVVQGGLLNPREMLDNRLGGLVNVKRPDSVTPLEQSPLNPFTFQILEKLQADRESTTGISALSQGLDKNAISKQNSKGLVDTMINVSSQRQKIMARNFAYDFLVPLYLEVIRLVIENEDKQKIIDVAGQPIQVSPQDWTERKTCTVAMHLGYGEKDQAVAKRQVAYQGLSSDPALQNVFGLPQKVAMLRDTMKLAGIWSNEYLGDPAKAPPIQPDPLKVKELEIKDKLAQAALIGAQVHVQKDKRLAALDAGKLDLQQRQYTSDTDIAYRDAERHDMEATARIDIADREMELEESMPDTSRKAIVSPNP